MPFQSEKQRRYLWANEPEIARDWTDTYGSRISRDNGGIMQGGVQNFLGQQPTVNAPKYWQSAPGHEMTELAYITPRERDTLVDMDMYGTMRGGPNEGPSGIMSLNGWGSTDPSQERAGGDMPDSSSGQGWDAPTFQPSGGPSYSTAKSPAELKLLSERKGGDTVLSSSMRNQLGMPAAQKRRGFNPLSIIGGAFGNVGRGIGFLLGKGKDWAGKMRGGINPKTGRYYTQQEYEEERSERIRNKRIQNILGRKAPITEMTQSNLGKLGYTGEMPGIGSTGTSRAIDRDVSMQDVLRERPFSANRLQEIQRGWNNRGITGTDASMDFAGARRAMTQPTTVNVPIRGKPGATFPFPDIDPYQQNYVSPNRITSEGIYGKGDYEDLVEQSDTSNIDKGYVQTDEGPITIYEALEREDALKKRIADERDDLGGIEGDLAFAPNSLLDQKIKQALNSYNETGFGKENLEQLMRMDLEQNKKDGTPLSLPKKLYSMVG